MNFEENKIKCASCGAYLFEEDDVVFCPECGAPHHRECYNALGRCALADKHGTPEQYDFSENRAVITPDASNGDETQKIKCPMCGCVYGADENSCPSCGVPSPGRTGRMPFSFDYLGGVPADLDLGEGVTADEAKQFVFSNSQRYLPRFAADKAGKKTSFNWAAFFFPCGWFLCRKMYKQGVFTGVLQIALSMLVLPFYAAMGAFLPDGIPTYGELYATVLDNVGKIGTPAVVCAFAALVLSFILRLVCGILGDHFYYKHTISAVSTMKLESEDMEEDLRRKGGVSFIMFMIGFMAVEYLPQLLFTLVY